MNRSGKARGLRGGSEGAAVNSRHGIVFEVSPCIVRELSGRQLTRE